jgi:hypothetical protein
MSAILARALAKMTVTDSTPPLGKPNELGYLLKSATRMLSYRGKENIVNRIWQKIKINDLSFETIQQIWA